MWVGYPDELKPMETEFNGQPVAGGTYPAAIWKTFVEAARNYKEYAPEEAEEDGRRAAHARAHHAVDARRAGADAPVPEPEGGAPTGEGGGAAPEDTAPQDTPPGDARRAAGRAAAAGAAGRARHGHGRRDRPSG